MKIIHYHGGTKKAHCLLESTFSRMKEELEVTLTQGTEHRIQEIIINKVCSDFKVGNRNLRRWILEFENKKDLEKSLRKYTFLFIVFID